MTEGNRQPEISQEEIKKLAEEYSSKGVYSIKWHEHPNVDRGSYTHFIAGYSAATGNRQLLSQLQQELKEAKEKFELYKRLVTEESKKIVELQNALTQSIELIKIWKGKAIASSGKSKEIIEERKFNTTIKSVGKFKGLEQTMYSVYEIYDEDIIK